MPDAAAVRVGNVCPFRRVRMGWDGMGNWIVLLYLFVFVVIDIFENMCCINYFDFINDI